MAYKPNEIGRLSLAQLTEYKAFSGITERQYCILKRKFYDADLPKIKTICKELHISPSTYNKELRKALTIIKQYSDKQ